MKEDGKPIIEFPRPPGRFQLFLMRWQRRIAVPLGWCMNKWNMAGSVAECTIEDETSGLTIEVRNSTRYTRVRINGRDFYFERVGGRFDGTGSGCG